MPRLPHPDVEHIVLDLWLHAPGKAHLVCIDYAMEDGLYCSKWSLAGFMLGLFFTEHHDAQQSFLEHQAQFIDRPAWAIPLHRPAYSLETSAVWSGDLDDDCNASWCNLLLCAEAMDETPDGQGCSWWWAVYERNGAQASHQVASVDDPPHNGKLLDTGEQARAAAQAAAREYIRGQL